MRFKNLGVGAKIFGGFIIVVVIALGIGGASYFSLNKVVKEAEINDISYNIRQKLEQARGYEKNFIICKDQKSYDDLLGTLKAIDALLVVLEAKGGKNTDIEGIREAKGKYVKSAAEMRKATLENASALTKLQSAAENITKISGEVSQKVINETHQMITEADKKTLKENALREIRSIVDVGYQVLAYYHDVGISKSAMLGIIRNLHFDETNYYFIVQEDLTLIAHGANPKLEGLDFGTIQDKKTGKTFMRELVKSAMENGESFTEYFWTKPGMGDAVFPKITYSKYFKPWGLIVCAGIYLEDIEKQVNQMQTMLNEGINKLQEANQIEILAQNARLTSLYYIIFKENADPVETYLNDLKKLNVATAELKTTADLYRDNFKSWTANDEHIQSQINATEKIALASLQSSENLSDSAKERFNKGALNGKRTVGIFIVIVAVAGLGCALLLKQNITRPIHRAIQSAMNSSDELSAASTQVSSASQSLAEGAAQQAASIEETSSSLEEMASMTKQNAANAKQADDLMREANNIFLQSKERMDELNCSMQDITQASEETQKIIKTIDEIAFQTNLLALNAAVEAARAGEAGAGFAVVADEVRNLAMRAAEAANHTTGLIEGSVKKIKEGSELVTKTNQGFAEVAASASKVGQLVAEIDAASNEQSEGVDQINKAVSEMDKITQSNAANAEESAAASEELNSQAEAMKDVVNGLVAVIGGFKNKKASEDMGVVKKVPQSSAISQKQSPALQSEKIKSYTRDEKIEKAEEVIPFDDEFEDF